MGVVYLVVLSIGNGRFTIKRLQKLFNCVNCGFQRQALWLLFCSLSRWRGFLHCLNVELASFEFCNTCFPFTFPTSMGCVCCHGKQMKLMNLPCECLVQTQAGH